LIKEQFIFNASLGGPGLDGYAYNADTYCIECGKQIIVDLVTAWEKLPDEIPVDTDEFPQPIFFGESDIEQYCADCGEYLYGENKLGEEDDPLYGYGEEDGNYY